MKPSLLHFNFMILRFFMLAPSHSGAAKAPPPCSAPSLLPVPVALVCHVACGICFAQAQTGLDTFTTVQRQRRQSPLLPLSVCLVCVCVCAHSI